MTPLFNLLERIALALESIASQAGLRRDIQDERIDELQNMLFAHCEAKRHTGTKRKEANHGTPKG